MKWKIFGWGSKDDTEDGIDEYTKKLDAKVNPTQASIRPGQHFINFQNGPELPVFGQILPVGDPIERSVYNLPQLKNYRLTRSYSIIEPTGAKRDMHVSRISAIIDEDLFEWYKDHHWISPGEL